MGLNISVFGVRYRCQYRFQPGLKEKESPTFFLICCWQGLWVHNSDLGGIEKFRFRHSILFSIALTSRLKQKQSATKIANLADFCSSKISANVTVFGCSKISLLET